MTRTATLVFAIAGGVAVGNLYWAQPLLGAIAETFGISPASAGLVATASQLGYAIGVFFLVPLGDIVNRKRVIPALMILSAVMLIATGLAPSFSILLGALALLGVTSGAGQFLTLMAGDLATDGRRGRVLGTVAPGLILGFLISRALSGIVLDLWGWRAIYFADRFPEHRVPEYLGSSISRRFWHPFRQDVPTVFPWVNSRHYDLVAVRRSSHGMRGPGVALLAEGGAECV